VPQTLECSLSVQVALRIWHLLHTRAVATEGWHRPPKAVLISWFSIPRVLAFASTDGSNSILKGAFT
jgi:hypothetical protein